MTSRKESVRPTGVEKWILLRAKERDLTLTGRLRTAEEDLRAEEREFLWLWSIKGLLRKWDAPEGSQEREEQPETSKIPNAASVSASSAPRTPSPPEKNYSQHKRKAAPSSTSPGPRPWRRRNPTGLLQQL
jgi:hypothetical protein